MFLFWFSIVHSVFSLTITPWRREHKNLTSRVKIFKLRIICILFVFIIDFHVRSVGKTQMNEQSSRSHFVFTLRISGVNEVCSVVMSIAVTFIHLAFSLACFVRICVSFDICLLW